MMQAAQIRSLRVQSALTGGLFIGCIVLALLIVSQRFRFEAFVKESYDLPKKELATTTQSFFDDLLQSDVDAEKWKRVPLIERRSVYLKLMQRETFPDENSVKACLKAESRFFLDCAERTIVCGNAEQRLRGLKFLELAGLEAANPALDRLLVWTRQTKRVAQTKEIEDVRDRMQSQSTL